MQNNKIKYLLFLSLAILLFPSIANALKGDAVTVKPIYPNNQEGGETGYFNLKVAPGEAQDIEIDIRNDSSEKITINVTALQATTSDTGVITYNEDKKEDDSTPYPFKDIAKLDKKEVVISASESEKVKVHLEIPTEAFSGKIVGGLTISEKRELTTDEKEQSIVNEFQYAIPIVLYENEDKIEPKIELVNIEPGLRNYRPYIQATIKNSSPININKMTIDSKVTNRSTNKDLITKKELNYQMAPTSSFNFGFDLQNSEVIPGEYLAEFKINADGKKFELKKAFTITKAKAEEINTQNLYSQEKKIPIWVIILLVATMLLIISAIIFWIMNKKKKKSSKRRNNKAHKKKSKKNKSK